MPRMVSYFNDLSIYNVTVPSFDNSLPFYYEKLKDLLWFWNIQCCHSWIILYNVLFTYKYILFLILFHIVNLAPILSYCFTANMVFCMHWNISTTNYNTNIPQTSICRDIHVPNIRNPIKRNPSYIDEERKRFSTDSCQNFVCILKISSLFFIFA
jgi:hypothetical protein